MRTPSQTVGPFFRIGLCAEPQNELPGGSVRIEGQVLDGENAPIDDAMLELWSPSTASAAARPTARAASRSSCRRTPTGSS